MFAVRVVTADYYLASPLKDLDVCYSEFRESNVKKVPVVRIFGATPAGQKTCLHLHGIFPYIYVPYDGYNQLPERYMRLVAFSIDRALNVTMGNPASNAQHIFKVALVSGMPFYGYHAKEKLFMKIYLYNPQMVKRVCDLLQSGAVMNKSYQPHEGHIPYLLQLFIDYNLYGMNLLNLAAVKFRRGRKMEPAAAEIVEDVQSSGSCPCFSPQKTPCTSKVNDSILGGTFVRWEESTLPCSLVLDVVEKQSTCELEVDAVAADILNHYDIQNQIGRNPGLQAIWEDEKQRRKENNQASQLDAPDSQDRGFVPVTESEKIFMNRVKEILKENEFDMSQRLSVGDEEDQDDLLDELTLHPDPLTPEGLLCTPANVVEVHRDSQTDSVSNSDKLPEEAIVDEEAILNLLENSATFSPHSQTSNHLSLLDGSQDHAIIDLLAGIEDDGFCTTSIRQNSQSQSLSRAGNYCCNSDEEEAEPELEKEDAELSFLMSQRWDNMPPENFSSIRTGMKEPEDGFSDDQQELSDEDMDWSGNNSLFANVSIPQLDGAADESSDSSLTDSGSRTKSSLIATDNMMEQPLDKHFQSKSNQDSSSECSKGLKVNKKIPFIPAVKHPVHPEMSPMSMDKEDLRTLYTYDKKTSIGLDKTDLESFTFSNRKVTENRKKYGSIKNVETNCLSILQNRRTFSLCYSELRNGSAKAQLEISQKESSSPNLKNISSSSSPMEDEFLDPQDNGMTKDSEEGDVGELKIRYEDYQENKTERTVVAQQEAHYKFFPSVILSNCLTRKKVGNKKLSDPDSVIGESHPRTSGLKINKKKFSIVGQRNKSSTVENSISNSHVNPGHISVTPACSLTAGIETQILKDDSVEVAETVNTVDPSIDGIPVAMQQVEWNRSPINGLIKSHSEEPATSFSNFSQKDEDFCEALLCPLQELTAKVTCTKPSALPGSKYTLRAKRKMAYDKEDGESSAATFSKYPVSHKERLKDKNITKGQEVKFTKRRKKEPPIIIKYIIINRFKGQKNMLVKISKVNTEEQLVMLTPSRVEKYNKLAPLKDFWPKIPESTAVKFPTPESKAKKHSKRKAKVNTTNKKTICTSSKPQAKQHQRVRQSKKCPKDLLLPSLQPPQPSYCKHADDHGTEYTDVMVELGYLSDRSPSPADSTPPRCWSPSDPFMDAKSSEQLIDPLSDPYLNSDSQKYSHTSKGAPKMSCTKPNKNVETKNKARKSIKVNQHSEIVKPIKERMKQCRNVAPRRRKQAKDTAECIISSSTIMPKQRRSRKKKNENSKINDFSKDTSQLFTEDKLSLSDSSSQKLPSLQHPGSTRTSSPCSLKMVSGSHYVEPKAEDCETSIVEASHNLSVLAHLKQKACQTTAVKIEELEGDRSSPADTSSEENDKEAQQRSASALARNSDMSPLSDTLSGLAVLKQLLQKREQGEALPLQTVGTNKPSSIKDQTTVLADSTAKATKSRKVTSTTLHNPKVPMSSTLKNKKIKIQKSKASNIQQNLTVKQEENLSDECPVLLSDPHKDSFIEDSLSPELPNNYNFDINVVDQTEFSSPYSGNQFVLTDKNLPVKFLSDVSQEPVSATQPLDFDKKLDKLLGCGEELNKDRSNSPDLFERPENVDFVSNHLTFLDSEKAKGRKWDLTSGKTHMLSPFQDFHCEKKELLFSVIDPVLPLPLSSASFDEHEGSLTGELPESMDGLMSTTPSSSPCSISSLSQVRASNLQRGTGGGTHILKPLMSPPTREEILSTLLDLEMSETTFQEPFCSDPTDAPEKPMEVGGHKLMVGTRLVKELAEFNGELSLEGLQFWKTVFSAMTHPATKITSFSQVHRAGNLEATKEQSSDGEKKVILLPCKNPPSGKRVQLWLEARKQYESLQDNVKTEKKGVGMKDVHSEGNELKSQPCGRLSNIRRQKRHNLSLVISPMRNTLSPCKWAEVSPISDAGSVDVKKPREKDDDDDVPPESPELPSWLHQTMISENHPVSPSLSPLKKAKENISPSCVSNKEECDTIPILLNSTPILKRRRRNREELEPMCSTPISEDEPASQRLQQQRRSKADPLRRVLLTTQMKKQFAALNLPKKDNSQIEGPSIANTYGFKISMQNLQDAKALHEVQHLTIMVMELHARTRRDLEPDPEFDPICALFYCISSDTFLAGTDGKRMTGTIVVNRDHQSHNQAGHRGVAPLLVRSGVSGLQVTYVTDEKELFQELVNIMRRFDPDILVGYEVQMRSWGYLLQRASVLGEDLCQQLSRVPGDSSENRFTADQDEYGADTMTEIHIVGRITLNLWRVMKTEVTLNNYTFENVAFHVLHQRFPLYSQRTLSDWFDHNSDLFRWKMVDSYVSRVRGTMQLLQQQDIIGRTSELARVFGIQFLHVLTRGSQYRVESMMLRVAKPLNYIPVTPSVQQRAHQRAPQCLPLVMEPESRFYSNSVVVLDFQSLYPSIIIAYNYCFSTCLGHVDSLGTPDEFKFGCTSLRIPQELLYQLRNDITVSPNGIAFVKTSVRKGILPSMLEEILNTRIMVKQSMKMYKQDKALMRLLHARQFGLKLIANVTFGYTAANYSGRMPSVEVGDSIVHKARETLERAIKLVNDTKKWGARVVYGDTDSMFVLLKGATKEQAFKIGLEIAEAVTATNPKPVKLKFEKVYLPCVLQTKKRYVGYMYESLDQKEPVFDAKGIETVRRDSCPAVSKILERSIKLLFETRDISQVKQFVQHQCIKVLDGRASMQDLTFAKEYRGSSSYRPGACVPALELTRRMMAYDRRSEPRVGERVNYVIVCGTPGVALIQLVRRPVDVLQDATLRLNATYYLTKQILPPLGRMFQLVGIDVFSWYKELPRIQKASCSLVYGEAGRRKGTISQYFTTLHCPVCDELTQLGVCSCCRAEPQRVAVTLHQDMRQWESQQDQMLKICRNCSGSAEQLVPCVSLDCPVLYKLSRVSRQLSKAPYLRQLLEQF